METFAGLWRPRKPFQTGNTGNALESNGLWVGRRATELARARNRSVSRFGLYALGGTLGGPFETPLPLTATPSYQSCNVTAPLGGCILQMPPATASLRSIVMSTDPSSILLQPLRISRRPVRKDRLGHRRQIDPESIECGSYIADRIKPGAQGQGVGAN